ncbi:MAG: ABC transporter ATP-binding protein [bacterium]
MLHLNGITKRFGPLLANDQITLKLHRGEVLALLGENGAGKTTLMNILYGHYVADAGDLRVFGQVLEPGSPAAALQCGLGMVHQHFTLADNLSVLDNITLGTTPLWHWSLRHREASRKVRELGERFGLKVDPRARVGDLSVGERQRVEILKALYRDARVLILDEPTAVLTPQETESFFQTLRQLVENGLSLIFISHKLPEVLAISDRIAVLRDGRLVLEVPREEASEASLATAMVGRELVLPQRKPSTPGDPVLELQQVSVNGPDGQRLLRSLSFQVCSGEIVGIAGVSGNGQRALADLISGLHTPHSGTLRLHGKVLERFHPRNMLEQQVGRIPEDRHVQGVVPDMTLAENAISEVYGKPPFSRSGWLNFGARQQFTEQLVQRFDVRGVQARAPIRQLSGGNMQKLILGRVLTQDPRLILANQPGRGLDVGAATYVQEQLLEARNGGAGVLLITEDLEELLRIADRVLVIHRGRLTEAGSAHDLSPTRLGLLMAGQQEASPHAA